MPQKNRRRFSSHLVNHQLRLRLVLDDVAFAFVAAMAAIGILYWLSNREIGDSLWSAHLSIKETRELLNKGMLVAGVVTFVAVILFGLWSLIDAHRIAGPMHRLKFLLDDVAAGKLDHEIQFRTSDEFQDVAASADALVEAYADRIGRLRELASEFEASLAGLSEDAAVRPRELASELSAQLSFFQLPEEPK